MPRAAFPRRAARRSIRPPALLYLRSGIRKEKLLAVNPVGGDRVLPFAGNHPVDECLSHLLPDPQAFRRVYQDDAVLVEQPPVAFDQDGKVAAVLEGQPRPALG